MSVFLLHFYARILRIKILKLLQLQKDKKLLKDYDDILSEYIKEVILEDVTNKTYVTNCHYLPHRPVVREDRSTTKIRIVFDASAKYQDEKSLNDILDKGSRLLPYLFDILLRFCVGKNGLIGDIKQTFLQIYMNKIICVYYGSTMLMIQHRKLKFFASLI